MMDKERQLLRAAGIIECIVGAITMGWIIGVPLILIGIYLFISSYDTDEEIIKNQYQYLLIAILSFINIISFAIILTVYDNIKKYNQKVNGINAPPIKTKYRKDAESKKIDILLKLGVGMIFVSGILFATTTWDFINNYIKAFALILFGALFIVLSIYTETKLNLYRSSYMYWLLGMSFFILTIVGILYFGIFGSYLTYTGAGKNLSYAITLLSTAGFTYATYLKYPKKYLLSFSYFSVIMAIYNIVTYQSQSRAIAMCVLTAITTLVRIINRKENNLSRFLEVISYTLLVLGIKYTTENEIALIVMSVINIINFNYKAFTTKDTNMSIIPIIITYVIFIVIGEYDWSFGNDINISMIILLSGIYTLLINSNVIKTTDKTKVANYIIYSILSLSIYTSSAAYLNIMTNYNIILVSLAHLMITETLRFGLSGSVKIEKLKYIEPLLFFLTVLSIKLTFLKDLTPLYVIALVSLVYSAVNYISKDKQTKAIYLVSSLIGTIITVIVNSANNVDTFISIIAISASLVLFLKTFENDDEQSEKLKTLTYIVLISSVYFQFIYTPIIKINTLLLNGIFIGMLVVIALLMKKKNINIATQFYIVVPLFRMINRSGLDYDISSIISSLAWLYIILLAAKYFAKDNVSKNTLIVVGLIIFLIDPFFRTHIYCGVYVGIIALLAIFIGFKSDDKNPVFITGIVITIANIAYRFRRIWKLVPFWLYLLLGGLLIIAFVTNREIKKK